MNNPDLTMKELSQFQEAADSAPDRAVAQYELGILLLNRYLRTSNKASRVKAIQSLRKTIAPSPRHVRAHAALGRLLVDNDKSMAEATAEWGKAHISLNPRNRIYEVYFITLMCLTGRTEDTIRLIASAAQRRGVDVVSVRRGLLSAGLDADPETVVRNAFIRTRHFLDSWVWDEKERILNSHSATRRSQLRQDESTVCRQFRDTLNKSFRTNNIPSQSATLIPLALRYGIGDDCCQEYFICRMSAQDRGALRKAANTFGTKIHECLDSFGNGEMHIEATTFIYLMLSAEERQ